MRSGPLQVAILGEDHVHFVLATSLFDALANAYAVSRNQDWFDAPNHREWYRTHPTGLPYYDSHQETRVTAPNGRPIPIHGHISGKALQPGARRFRELYLFHTLHASPPDLIVLLQDTDGHTELSQGAQQVLSWITNEQRPPLVIGMPHRDAEAWFFLAPHADATTQEKLKIAAQILSFQPHKSPERLTGQPNHAVTDAKRVLQFALLHQGDTLEVGIPASIPPNLEEARHLLEPLLNRVGNLGEDNCNLHGFIRQLQAVIPDLFKDELGAG